MSHHIKSVLGLGHYVNILARFRSVWVCTVIFWVGLGRFGSAWVGLGRFGSVRLLAQAYNIPILLKWELIMRKTVKLTVHPIQKDLWLTPLCQLLACTRGVPAVRCYASRNLLDSSEKVNFFKVRQIVVSSTLSFNAIYNFRRYSTTHSTISNGNVRPLNGFCSR